MYKKPTNAALCALGCRRGAAMVEYAMLAALIAVVATTAITTVGSNVKAKFAAVAAAF
ncbi:MAG: Flp family type IVb pilin [Pseudomonadota bacterium]|nr:Flp family type IVb pilin [Pseudomonadota bacterium]